MPLFRKQIPTEAQLSLTAQGLQNQNFSRASVGTSSAMVSGTVYFMLLGVDVGDVITNIHLSVIAAGVTSTLAKVGLYNIVGTRLALSANLTTAWDSVGMKTGALTAPYTVVQRGGIYVALLNVAGTGASPLRGNSSTTGNDGIGSGVALYGTESGQTDLDASATIGDTSPLSFWVGIS